MENRYLFRGKRIDNGEWVVGNLIVDKQNDIETGKPIEIIGIYPSEYKDFSKKTDPSTICQCTGLKDKNGKLIYENDIVKGKYFYGGKSYRHIGQVKYVLQSYKVVGVNQYSGYHSELDGLYEVIGNVFDNHEQLKGVSYDGE